MSSTKAWIAAVAAAALLAGCATREIGSEVFRDDFGTGVNDNMRAQMTAYGGDRALVGLSQDFRRSAPDTINFAFDSAGLDPAARAILDQQAGWIVRHPSVRLRIYGNTDLVGSAEYNYRLGLRRAQAAASYLVSRGVSSRQLEAVVSFGQTRPIIVTDQPERINRRTVTEVFGYVQNTASFDFDGKRAERVYEAYVAGENEAPGDETGSTAIFVAQ